MLAQSVIKISAVAIVLLTSGCLKEKPVTLTTDDDRQSYAIGQTIGKDIKSQGVYGDEATFVAGLSDALAGNSQMSDEELKVALGQYQEKRQANKQKQLVDDGARNQSVGAKFLGQNKTQEGVTATASGLQYKVIKKGKGRKSPAVTDKVTVHYTGSLLNGKVFDSSRKRNQPTSFQLNQVIKGWTEGLQLMKEGDVFQLFIPSQLAYGAAGAAPVIGPNETLVFEVELIKIGS